MIDIEKALQQLKLKRTIFTSEADFQLELAWILKDMYPQKMVRCEYSPEFNLNMHIDILVIEENGKWIPVELKYKTKGCQKTVDGCVYYLKNHSAKDVNCYLFLQDVQRIEYVKKNLSDVFSEGYAILLTNELSYEKKPEKENCNYKQFALYEGAVKNGIIDWMPGTGEGTKKGHEVPIILEGEYNCNWKPYSLIDSSNSGEFKTLIMRVN